MNYDFVRNILNEITLDGHSNLVDSKIISGLVVRDNNIGFSIDVELIGVESAKNLEKLCQKVIKGNLKEDPNLTIILTSHKKAEVNKAKLKDKHSLPNIKELIVVASGKGGVGKSTVASLIAKSLKDNNKMVGILDADIYGPSIAHMSGTNKRKPQIVNGKMQPIYINDIALMSISYLFEENKAAIWRGPMVTKALYNLINLTEWGNLDYLIIDTPPGTGDIHLSLLENYFIDKVVFVSTPQKISLIDVARSIDLYKKFNVKILGVVKNRINNASDAYFSDFLQEMNISLMGELDYLEKITEFCDQGKILENADVSIKEKTGFLARKIFF